jgi:hypothetical protein
MIDDAPSPTDYLQWDRADRNQAPSKNDTPALPRNPQAKANSLPRITNSKVAAMPALRYFGPCACGVPSTFAAHKAGISSAISRLKRLRRGAHHRYDLWFKPH